MLGNYCDIAVSSGLLADNIRKMDNEFAYATDPSFATSNLNCGPGSI